jgi:hypothetical protein
VKEEVDDETFNGELEKRGSGGRRDDGEDRFKSFREFEIERSKVKERDRYMKQNHNN